MDAAYATRSVTPPPAARLDPAPVKQAVQTDLPPQQSVLSSRDSQQTASGGTDTRGRNAAMLETAPSQASEVRRQATRDVKVTVDEATSDLVYQTVDDYGDVIAQFPNETMMKIRAYVREDAAPSASEADLLPPPKEATQPHVERLA